MSLSYHCLISFVSSLIPSSFFHPLPCNSCLNIQPLFLNNCFYFIILSYLLLSPNQSQNIIHQMSIESNRIGWSNLLDWKLVRGIRLKSSFESVKSGIDTDRLNQLKIDWIKFFYCFSIFNIFNWINRLKPDDLTGSINDPV